MSITITSRGLQPIICGRKFDAPVIEITIPTVKKNEGGNIIVKRSEE